MCATLPRLPFFGFTIALRKILIVENLIKRKRVVGAICVSVIRNCGLSSSLGTASELLRSSRRVERKGPACFPWRVVPLCLMWWI